MITVEVDRQMLRYVQKRLGEMQSQAPKVISRALNDTARTGRVSLTKGVQQRYVAKTGSHKEERCSIKKQHMALWRRLLLHKGKP